MTTERLIKKYPNRRLYDTEESRYITLAEVKDLVMRAIPFKVLDSQTEDDITRTILLQIIMDQEAGGSPMFTAAMLERFIRFYGDTAQAAFTTFLDQSLDLFLKQQRMFTEQMQGVWGGNPMEFWVKLGQQNMGFWKDMEELSRKSASADENSGDKTLTLGKAKKNFAWGVDRTNWISILCTASFVHRTNRPNPLTCHPGETPCRKK
jgi:polyhydroxyalkanoate synthesis repressor PhaR